MDPFREPPGASRGLFCVFRTFGVGYRVSCVPRRRLTPSRSQVFAAAFS